MFEIGDDLYRWHTANRAGVDFILYGARGLKAFEVKRTSRISEGMPRGLRIFQKDYPPARSCFIYGGKRRYYEGNITILPVEEALLKLSDIL